MTVHVRELLVGAGSDLVSRVELAIAGIENGRGEIVSVSHATVNSATTSVLIAYRKVA